MKSPTAPTEEKETPKDKPPRHQEALRIIEAYATDLREIIKKLRGKFN